MTPTAYTNRESSPLPDEVNRFDSKVTIETLNLRPTMLVNVTPTIGQ
jgi:hypothetical protein